MSVTIRPLEPQDETQWRALWRGYLAYYETELPERIYAETFSRLLGDDPRDYSGLVAVEAGKPVGLTHYLFHRHGWKIEDVCYLQDLFVAPERRGTGIARKLIEAVYDRADRHGASQVYWLTQDFNTAGRRLYDRVGQLTPFIKYQRP
jgi:GNAT superfamily N-acetyltransferase